MSEQQTEPQQEFQEEKKKSHGCLIAIITIIIIALGVFAIIRLIDKTTGGNTDRTLTSRPATYADIDIEMSGDFSLSAIYYIKPNADISNLQITMKFYKSNDELIVSKVKTIGNVKKGEQYSIKFGITDFTFSQLLDMSLWNYEVTGGTVSYFS